MCEPRQVLVHSNLLFRLSSNDLINLGVRLVQFTVDLRLAVLGNVPSLVNVGRLLAQTFIEVVGLSADVNMLGRVHSEFGFLSRALLTQLSVLLHLDLCCQLGGRIQGQVFVAEDSQIEHYLWQVLLETGTSLNNGSDRATNFNALLEADRDRVEVLVNRIGRLLRR